LRTTALAAALLALAGGVAVAQEDHGGGAPAGAGRIATLNDFGVVPTMLVVAPGQRVVWINAGFKRHTVTADDGAFDSGVLGFGERFTLTASSVPGDYAYHCKLHTFIRGRVVVSPLDLRPSADAVPYGGRVALSGTVPGAPAGTAVDVQRRVAGAWQTVAAAAIGADGGFRTSVAPLRARAVLRAVAGDTVSPPVRVRVRVVVDVVRSGRRATVRVRPAQAGLEAHLESLDLDTYVWHSIGRPVRLGASGRGTVVLPRGGGVFRIAVDPPGGALDGGTSQAVAVRGAAAH
jgi:plastocyanin